MTGLLTFIGVTCSYSSCPFLCTLALTQSDLNHWTYISQIPCAHKTLKIIIWSPYIAILENVGHCWGEPEHALWLHMNRLSITLKSWAESLVFMSAVYARALHTALFPGPALLLLAIRNSCSFHASDERLGPGNEATSEVVSTDQRV